MKPNIFDIATSELSQDAFIVWLLKFADPQCEQIDTKLHQCAKNFLTELIKAQDPEFKEKIDKIDVVRQWNKVDIKAEINQKYLLIIEDKTHSGEHSSQLERYKEKAIKYAQEKNLFPIFIYLKTGNESLQKKKAVENKGYSVFYREQLLAILQNHQDIKNEIYQDFLNRLTRLENNSKVYETLMASELKYQHAQGFFQALERTEKFDDMHWKYAHNQTGGLLYCAFSKLKWKIAKEEGLEEIASVYLQLEIDRKESKKLLCFKVISPKSYSTNERKKLRNELYKLIKQEASKQNIDGIEKPARFGNGRTMTYAVVDAKYWLGDGKLDVEKTVTLLKAYQEFLCGIIDNR